MIQKSKNDVFSPLAPIHCIFYPTLTCQEQLSLKPLNLFYFIELLTLWEEEIQDPALPEGEAAQWLIKKVRGFNTWQWVRRGMELSAFIILCLNDSMIHRSTQLVRWQMH